MYMKRESSEIRKDCFQSQNNGTILSKKYNRGNKLQIAYDEKPDKLEIFS